MFTFIKSNWGVSLSKCQEVRANRKERSSASPTPTAIIRQARVWTSSGGEHGSRLPSVVPELSTGSTRFIGLLNKSGLFATLFIKGRFAFKISFPVLLASQTKLCPSPLYSEGKEISQLRQINPTWLQTALKLTFWGQWKKKAFWKPLFTCSHYPWSTLTLCATHFLLSIVFVGILVSCGYK